MSKQNLIPYQIQQVYPDTNTLSYLLSLPQNQKYIQPEMITLTYQSFSKIDQIHQKFLDIPYIHLSHNNIFDISGLNQFFNIQGLSISHNKLQNWQDLLVLEQKNNIVFLRVRRNPLCINPNYHSFILANFVNLQKLDDVKIDQKCFALKYLTQNLSQVYILQFIHLLQVKYSLINQIKNNMVRHKFEEEQIFFDNFVSFLNFEPMLKLKKLPDQFHYANFFIRLWKIMQPFINQKSLQQTINQNVLSLLQTDLLNRILCKYKEKHDHTLQHFLKNQCEINTRIDKNKFLNRQKYTYKCYINELLSISDPPIPQETKKIQIKNLKTNAKCDWNVFFPLFLLNNEYMQAVFECVVDLMMSLLHSYEILIYGDKENLISQFEIENSFKIFNPSEIEANDLKSNKKNIKTNWTTDEFQRHLTKKNGNSLQNDPKKFQNNTRSSKIIKSSTLDQQSVLKINKSSINNLNTTLERINQKRIKSLSVIQKQNTNSQNDLGSQTANLHSNLLSENHIEKSRQILKCNSLEENQNRLNNLQNNFASQKEIKNQITNSIQQSSELFDIEQKSNKFVKSKDNFSQIQVQKNFELQQNSKSLQKGNISLQNNTYSSESDSYFDEQNEEKQCTQAINSQKVSLNSKNKLKIGSFSNNNGVQEQKCTQGQFQRQNISDSSPNFQQQITLKPKIQLEQSSYKYYITQKWRNFHNQFGNKSLQRCQQFLQVFQKVLQKNLNEISSESFQKLHLFQNIKLLKLQSMLNNQNRKKFFEKWNKTTKNEIKKRVFKQICVQKYFNILKQNLRKKQQKIIQAFLKNIKYKVFYGWIKLVSRKRQMLKGVLNTFNFMKSKVMLPSFKQIQMCSLLVASETEITKKQFYLKHKQTFNAKVKLAQQKYNQKY